MINQQGVLVTFPLSKHHLSLEKQIKTFVNVCYPYSFTKVFCNAFTGCQQYIDTICHHDVIPTLSASDFMVIIIIFYPHIVGKQYHSHFHHALSPPCQHKMLQILHIVIRLFLQPFCKFNYLVSSY